MSHRRRIRYERLFAKSEMRHGYTLYTKKYTLGTLYTIQYTPSSVNYIQYAHNCHFTLQDEFFAGVKVLVDKGIVAEKDVRDDGIYLELLDAASKVDVPSIAARQKGFLIAAPSSSNANMIHKSEKISVPIAIYLQKGGKLKLRNIETNAKCQLFITGDCTEVRSIHAGDIIYILRYGIGIYSMA